MPNETTPAAVIDIKAFIDAQPISPFQWVMVAICFLIVVADGMDVAIMGFVAPSILKEWHISRPAFGLVISAAPFGLAIGALVAGPSSDRFGRKPVLIVAVLVFALLTLLAAYAADPTKMAALRFLAGMGMGAAMPNATTLLAEYAPERRRSLLVTIMFSGFVLGSALIGFVAGYLIPIYGWRAVMLVGGAVPLLLLPFIVLLLPESARFLALEGVPAARVGTTLGRVTGVRFKGDETFVSNEPSLETKRPIGVLFSRRYADKTIALWVTCFMGLMVVYLLTGWLPTLMADAGASISTASNVTAMFQVGAIFGGISFGWVMDRVVRPGLIIAAGYFGGALCVLAVAQAGIGSGLLAALLFAAGFCVSGAQTALNAFAPNCYPTMARATGVGWMLGVGRFGSILGSAIGGALLGLGWGLTSILSALAFPALFAAVAIALAHRDASTSSRIGASAH